MVVMVCKVCYGYNKLFWVEGEGDERCERERGLKNLKTIKKMNA